MRGRTNRQGRATTESHPQAPSTDQTTWRGIAAGYGMVLLVLVVLWAISHPLLASGAIALVVGTYTLVRVGARIVRARPWRGQSVTP